MSLFLGSAQCAVPAGRPEKSRFREVRSLPPGEKQDGISVTSLIKPARARRALNLSHLSARAREGQRCFLFSFVSCAIAIAFGPAIYFAS